MSRAIYLAPWRIDLTLRDGIAAVPVTGGELARAVAAALRAASAPGRASIGLILSDDAELAELNASHLGHTGPTDVLSFPLLPPEAYPPHPGVPRLAPTTGVRPATTHDGKPRASPALGTPTTPRGFALPPGRRVHLGDIVVSVERAIEQADSGRGGQTGNVRWSAADELRLLVTHGTLHICGWDHADPNEEAAMRALESRLLGIA